jgi:hypothetical protein
MIDPYWDRHMSEPATLLVDAPQSTKPSRGGWVKFADLLAS